ncbi:MAG: hypothetical protein ACREPD_04700 [Stenotrophomonas sp.]|uniref:hypothetical protein n=1 Tax=Stenotrophomonas sp. TaxID=69392 RepID=UPI003D6D824C
MASRGIRNNNPGNIDRSSANKWQGRMARDKMTAAQRAESRFEVFSTPAWGIRAMCILLINYQDRHGCNTVKQIIARWAPPVENDTGAYANQVASALGVRVDQFINTHEYNRMRPLVEAIIRHENGSQPYPSDVIEEGLRLAGIVRPGGAALVATPQAATTATVTALAAGGTAAVVEGVNQLLPAVQSMNAVAMATSALPSSIRIIAGAAVVVSVGASIYAWWRLRRARKAVHE